MVDKIPEDGEYTDNIVIGEKEILKCVRRHEDLVPAESFNVDINEGKENYTVTLYITVEGKKISREIECDYGGEWQLETGEVHDNMFEDEITQLRREVWKSIVNPKIE